MCFTFSNQFAALCFACSAASKMTAVFVSLVILVVQSTHGRQRRSLESAFENVTQRDSSLHLGAVHGDFQIIAEMQHFGWTCSCRLSALVCPAMKDISLLLAHLLTTIAKLLGPGGERAIVAESLLTKQQLLIINRAWRCSPKLTALDRYPMSFCSLFLPLRHIRRAAVTLSAVMSSHDAPCSITIFGVHTVMGLSDSDRCVNYEFAMHTVPRSFQTYSMISARGLTFGSGDAGIAMRSADKG